jgi:acetyl esterase/lipase
MKPLLVCLTLLAAARTTHKPKPQTPPPLPLPIDGRVERDIPYLGADRAERADLYLPAKVAPGERFPAVVVIHGGGWIDGDKAAARELNICGTLAQHGYAALSINYRLGKKDNASAAWPQNMHDCKTAVRWLRKIADRYGIDAEHIGAIGSSAGGHLAALLGVTGPADGLDPTEPFGDVPAGVSCVVDLYGPIQLRAGAIDAKSDMKTSPLTYLDKDDPPFLLIHGTADKTVSIERSREFAAALKKAGIEHELVEIEGAAHTFHLQPKQRDLRPLVLAFFDKHLRPAK